MHPIQFNRRKLVADVADTEAIEATGVKLANIVEVGTGVHAPVNTADGAKNANAKVANASTVVDIAVADTAVDTGVVH
jgi:hypothetical protein